TPPCLLIRSIQTNSAFMGTRFGLLSTLRLLRVSGRLVSPQGGVGYSATTLAAASPGWSGKTGVEISYDVAADGQRCIINSPIPGTATPPTVVLNWAAELPR